MPSFDALVIGTGQAGPALAAKLALPEYFRQPAEALKADAKRSEDVEALMLEKLERWEALEAKAAPGGQ